MYGALETALEIGEPRGRDMQINPHAVRSDLEFLVIPFWRRLGLQECLGDIAVPQVITTAARIGVIEDEQRVISANEPQVER